MIEDDPKVEPRDQGGPDRYGESLLYDLGKFLTSLSLLAIGGVLTVADTADRADIKPVGIILVTVVLAIAAVLAASTASSIAYGRFTGKPVPQSLANYILGTVSLLGMGLGMFFYMWIDKLN